MWQYTERGNLNSDYFRGGSGEAGDRRGLVVAVVVVDVVVVVGVVRSG